MIDFLPAREVAMEIFGWPVRWYGVLYVVAFWLAYRLLPRLQTYRQIHLSKEQWLEILALGAVGVIAGGRLGYVVFYEPRYFLMHPLEIFSLWTGGLSSHGGFIGVALALWWVARQFKINFWALTDVAVVPAALGLALGRLGNFINQELYVSSLGHLAAIGKDVLIAGVCFLILRRGAIHRAQGAINVAPTIVFLILYALLRFLTEYLRVQEFPLLWGLTRGQLLTLPIMAAGLWLLVTTWPQKPAKGF